MRAQRQAIIRAVTNSPPITIVAIHGNGGGGFRWDRIPQPVAAGVVLRGPSLPGFSGRPLPAGKTTMTTFTDAVIEELESVQSPRILLGHGIGGAITIDVVAQRPDLVDGLILHAPVAANLESRLFPKVMQSMFIRRAAKRIISSWPMRKVASRLIFAKAPQPYVERFLAEYRRADAFEVMFDLLTAGWYESLPVLTVPSVVLWGEKDRVLQVEQAEAVEKKLADVSRHIEPSWGHYPMIEQPEDYARALAVVARDLIDR